MYTKTLSILSDALSFQGNEAAEGRAKFVLVFIIGFLTALWILSLLVRKSGDKLPPGPKGLPLVGNLPSLDPDLHTYLASLAQTYGPIYTLRLGRKTGIVITSPDIAKQVLKDQDTAFANRDVPVAANETSYGGKDIVWTPYGPEWRMLRKVCVREMLCNNTMDSVYALRRREIRETVRYLYSSMMWGGTVVGDRRAVLGGAEFKKIVGEMTELLGMPNLSDFYPGLERFDFQGIRKKMKALAKRLDKIFDTVIDQRLKMNGEGDGSGIRKDFLQVLLQMRDDEDARTTPFTMTHLKALLMDMLLGGTDTTSNTVEYALAEMMNKPEILAKVQQELDTVIGKDNMVEESDINKLPYLYAVMKEVLRLHPTLPLLVPHCPSMTCSVSGYTIPKGARVFVNVWAIHRDPSVWENPLDFCPDRFSDGKWDYTGNDFRYFPFGSGRRICAGIAMAERMFMFSLASLLHSFDWSSSVGEKMDLSEKFGIVLKKKMPLIAIPTPRLSNPSLYYG
ncbi:hypothetical protein OROGR_005569 [Orobanche gracilis]